MLLRRLLPVLLTIVVSGPVLSEPVVGAEHQTLADAVQAGDAHVALRYRFEFVDQEGFEENAKASTVRLRLNYQSSAWRGWSAFGEFDYVGELLFDEFNSGAGTSPDRTQYPVVADPEGADLNQLYADYDTGDWRLRLGRQRIVLDDQRFIGGVAWRQNEQTFDSISLTGNASRHSEFFYAWVANANRIYGDGVPAGDHRMSTHLLNVRLRVHDALSATPYAYYIDNDDNSTFSTATVGLRLNGTRESGSGKFAWLAEFARQSDTANAPVDFDAGYWHLEANWTPAGRWPAMGIGIASLGGNSTTPGAAFRTPLATLHAFQGWADQFLATPDAGVVDIYGSLGYEFDSWVLEGIYHNFSAEDGAGEFGWELDVSVAHKLGSRYVLTLAAAYYDAASPAFSDAFKAWLMFTAAY